MKERGFAGGCPLCSQGSMRRVRAGTDRPMVRSIASGGDPKVSKGERREARAQWAQPPQAVSAPEFRQTTSGAHGSAGRADCLPRGKPFGAPAGAIPCPRRGMTCRLPEGVQGASGKPPASSIRQQLCRKKFPFGGLTRRLRREGRACSPMGRSHFSFGGERKVCKRKPAARRLREKALDCPF